LAYFQVKNDGNVHKVHQDIHQGRQATVNNVSNIADYSEDTYQHIVTKDFNMNCVIVKFVIAKK
jgi:hypothetical protein